MTTLDYNTSRMGAVLELPKGQLAVSTVLYDAYEPRIIGFDPIVEQFSGGQDDITLTLENTTKDSLGANRRRVSDYWDFDNPPEGSSVKVYDLPEDGPTTLLFWGYVSEIESITEEFVVLHIRSADTLLDKVLGDAITLDDWPNCPDANVGKRKPVLYGSVTEFNPVLVDDNQITKLTSSVLKADTILPVEDASSFPNTGNDKLEINDEIVKYTWRNDTQFGNTANPCSRAQDGTNAGSHAAGDDVHEHGSLDYMVANHAVSNISNVKLVNSQGVKIFAPTTIFTKTLTSPAKVTFSKVPRTYAQSGGSIFKDIDTSYALSANTATNPLFACGRNTNWTEYNYAEIGTGQKLVIARNGSVHPIVHPPSPIKRAYLVIEHYGVGNLSSPGQIDVELNDVALGSLTATSNTPEEVKEDSSVHRETRGFEDTHGHTIPGSNHSHGMGGEEVNPNFHTIYPWFTNAYAYDNDMNTAAQLTPSISSDIRLFFLKVPNESGALNQVRISVVHGSAFGVTENASCQASLYIDGTIYQNHETISSAGTQTRWNSTTKPVTGKTVASLLNTNSYVHLDGPISAGFSFYVWEVWINIWADSVAHDVGPTQSDTPLNRSSYTWFDVTSQLTGADDAAKWQWFQDKKVECIATGVVSGEKVYVLRAFLCVEFVNAEKEFTKNILCDVASTKAATGDGATILYDVATSLGGIPAANVDVQSFTDASGDSPNVYGGALTEFETTHETLQRLGEQFRISVHYEAGELKALFKPLVSDMDDPLWSVTENDLLKGTFTVSRLPIKEIFNTIRINYLADYENGGTKKTKVVENATSQTRYGRTGELAVEADFIKTDAEATNLGNQLLDYNAWITDVLDFVLTRDFIGIKRGDLISVGHRLGGWPLCEVLEIEKQPATKEHLAGVRVVAIARQTG